MKTSNYLQLALLVGLIVIALYSTRRSNILLNKCSIESKALIIDKFKIGKRGWFIKYKYEVNNLEYKSSVPIKGEKINMWFEGNTIEIVYSCEDNSVSKYLPPKVK